MFGPFLSGPNEGVGNILFPPRPIDYPQGPSESASMARFTKNSKTSEQTIEESEMVSEIASSFIQEEIMNGGLEIVG